MAHQTLKLLPGVDTIKTPTLNEAAVSSCQLIRYKPDRSGLGLVEKLGGWARFFPTPMSSAVRALWAWQDTNNNKWLASGCDTSSVPNVGSMLTLIKGSQNKDITPHVLRDSVAVNASTVLNSSTVTIVDAGSNISSYVSVFIPLHISVGGLILFGFYPCTSLNANSWQLSAQDLFGAPLYATATVNNGGAVAQLSTTNGSPIVKVTLPNHGYQVGSTWPLLLQTTVGGVTLVGEYAVQTVVDANNFTVFGPSNAISTVNNQSLNGGNALYDYYLAYGPLPPGTGYGVGGYGAGGYGSGQVPQSNAGQNIAGTDWTLDNFGRALVACPTGLLFGSPDGTTRIGGPIYLWDPQQNTQTATVLSNGPVANSGAFVAMPQQQIIAYGSTFDGVQDPLLVRWCDVANPNVWIASPTNQAGSRRLPRGSLIVGGGQFGLQAFLWTDLALWSMQYIGGTGIYGFNEISTGCGMIAKKAVATVNSRVIWMGAEQFFVWDGSGVSILPCPVWDMVFQNLDQNNLTKIRAGANSDFGEFILFYPSLSGGGEVDSYVKYNSIIGASDPAQGWDFGTLQRTAWINRSVLGAPIAGTAGGLIFQHEISPDADGQAMLSSFTTGYFAVNEGDFMTFINEIWPDMKWGQAGGSQNAQVKFTFSVKNYPNDTVAKTYGPFTVSQAVQYFNPLFRGRLVSFSVSSSDVGSFWRLGATRYRGAPDGRYG